LDNIAGNGGSGYAALAYYDGGGGSKTVNITNCTFKGNSGDDSSSAAIHNRGAVMNIENSVFWNNMAVAGIYKQYGSGTISYSAVQDGVYGSFTDGGNNVTTYPNFVSISDPHLKKGSPCIDTGNNSAPYILSKDYDGDNRIIDGDLNSSEIVDMGFDEYNPAPVPDITANGSDGPISIPEGFALEILVTLNTVDYTGEYADWWILKQTPNPPPNKWYYFDLASKNWQPGRLPTKQGKLFDITIPKKVPKTSGLTPGTYKFYFAVDLNMDGNLSLTEIFYDKVKVIIYNP
jgi:hypothetical protein